MKVKHTSRVARRKKRVSSNIFGTKDRPRIVIFRSNKYTYAQAIDDEARKTMVSFSSQQLAKKESSKHKKSESAHQVGVELAKMLQEKKVTKGVFDRSMYTYLGRVKAVAEGLREGGLQI